MEGFTFDKFAVLCGIIGFILICVSFLTGMRIIKIPGKYHIHKKVGIVGFIIVAIHATFMIIHG